MPRTFENRKFPLLYILPYFVITSTVFAMSFGWQGERTADRFESRHLLQASNNSLLFQCIPSGISSFPGDFFSQEQRQRGGVLIHLIITIYICAMIAVVCGDYFIPSLDVISEKLNLPSDVAGATFMAIGTSAPELFSSITGSFITQGDIGVGTIIGSAVFNILAVTGIVGLVLWNEELDIDWYPIARDCTVYGLTIACLIWMISDNIVTWWESLILLTIFVLYIIIICFNTRIENRTKDFVSNIPCCSSCTEANGELTPLLSQQVLVPELLYTTRKLHQSERDSFSVDLTSSKDNAILSNGLITASIANEVFYGSKELEGTLCSPPVGGFWNYLWWILMYPSNVLFFLTIPDCQSDKLQKLYPLTFLMSVLWIGVLSYLAVWMVTIIGYTLSIPDSVSGLTILAAGTSVPEIISSVIVARSGFGNMAISNLVGSNTFDISFCLGAPWLIKTLITDGYLIVYSSAMTYTTATLLLTLAAYVLIFQMWHWKINRTVGFVCLAIYILFVVLSCLYELNVFGEINLPTCDS